MGYPCAKFGDFISAVFILSCGQTLADRCTHRQTLRITELQTVA